MGRIIDYISHSKVWSSSAIFIEEDDGQNGVDHVDGYRSPGYIVSPYAVQYGATDHTYYTQVNMTRTMEQILGLTPMNQFDLIALPMRTVFTNNPPAENFQLWTHVANAIPLTQGVTDSAAVRTDSPAIKALRAAWLKKKAEIFAGRQQKPDSEDPDTVNHLNWYQSTGLRGPIPVRRRFAPPATSTVRRLPPQSWTTKTCSDCKALSPMSGERALYLHLKRTLGLQQQPSAQFQLRLEPLTSVPNVLANPDVTHFRVLSGLLVIYEEWASVCTFLGSIWPPQCILNQKLHQLRRQSIGVSRKLRCAEAAGFLPYAPKTSLDRRQGMD
jgi:hypothetical protein